MNRPVSPRLRALGRVWLLYVVLACVGALGALVTGAGPRAVASTPAAVTALAPAAATSGALLAADPATAPSAAAPTAATARMEALRAQRTPLGVVDYALGVVGLASILLLCWLMSPTKRLVPWRLVAWGMGLQLAFGIFVLKTGPGLWLFSRLNDGVSALLDFTQKGTDFLFASFITHAVEPAFVNFTFQVLPTIIFFSSLMTVLYHAGIMQKVVWVFAVAMQRTMKCSGAETLSTAANIFVGQTEAPLVVKPFVEKMTNSELMAVMVGGFANTAGGVLAAYVGMLRGDFPEIAGHLIAQSVMSAPAALVCAKLAFPETRTPETAGTMKLDVPRIDANLVDAAARGATEGLHLAFNVAAMLLAFIALIAMVNAGLGALGGALGHDGLTLQRVFGVVFWPLAWLMGVPSADCGAVAQLVGTKTVVNEFVAYLDLARMLRDGDALSYRSVVISTYALSGFANFSSIAIQIGGIAGIAESRRGDLARLGLRAMAVGALATFTTAIIAGLLV